MNVSTDILDVLYTAIVASALKTSITGGVYKFERPENSNKEDIIINCLPITGNTVQSGIANVNIHVSDLVLKAGDKTQKYPDIKRIKTLSDLAKTVMTGYGSNYNYYIESQHTLKDSEGANNYYINFRIAYNFHNS